MHREVRGGGFASSLRFKDTSTDPNPYDKGSSFVLHLYRVYKKRMKQNKTTSTFTLYHNNPGMVNGAESLSAPVSRAPVCMSLDIGAGH